MNSKQLNFFVSPEDLQSIYCFFNKHKVKYVKDIVDESHDPILSEFPLENKEIKEPIHLMSDEFKSFLVLTQNDKTREYSVDCLRSYILDFSPGGFYPATRKVLHRGRFYCTTSYFVSNGESVAKSDAFKSWVNTVFRLFKKEFLVQYTANKSILFSKNVIKWIEDNNGRVDTAFLKVTI